jgi:hypothetical protein
MFVAHSVVMKPSTLVLAFTLVACAADPSDYETGEDDLSQRGFAYTCTAASSAVLDKAQLSITVTEDHIRFTGDDGFNYGGRDRNYSPRSGAQRVRYDNFAWGEDCSLKMVIDRSAILGAAGPKMYVQCSNSNEFVQDIYQCAAPRGASLRIPASSKVPAPVRAPKEPNASAPVWNCKTPFGPFVGDEITVKLDDQAVRIDGETIKHGVRSTSSSSSSIVFNDFEYGGDCTLSVVADKSMLLPTARSAKFAVKCKGDVLEQNLYSCMR